jgi:hypothetical protein
MRKNFDDTAVGTRLGSRESHECESLIQAHSREWASLQGNACRDEVPGNSIHIKQPINLSTVFTCSAPLTTAIEMRDDGIIVHVSHRGSYPSKWNNYHTSNLPNGKSYRVHGQAKLC